MSSPKSIVKQYHHLFKAAYSAAVSSQDYLNQPDSDFSRNRILSRDTVLQLNYHLSDQSLQRFVPYIPGLQDLSVSPSAISQARDKVKYDFYKNQFNLFNLYTNKDNTNLYQGYRLIAIDGSEINVLADPANPQLTNGRSKKGGHHHFVHLNAAYDVLNKVFVDVVIQPGSQKNENAALLELVKSASDHSIFIADRGYESLMTFYKLNQSHIPFVIRIKDEQSSTSILKYYPTPNLEEYDIPFDVTLTSKNNSYVKQHWDTYKYISSYKKHPEFTKETTELPLNIRVVRYKAVSEGKESYITVATNLPLNEFDTDAVKEIYRLRWQEEISFDELKHGIDLDTIHSRKMNKILCEIYAKLSVYNLCSRIRNALEQRKKKKKHIHKLDFRFLIDRVREILFKKKIPKNLDDRIRKRTQPERPNRADKRH